VSAITLPDFAALAITPARAISTSAAAPDASRLVISGPVPNTTSTSRLNSRS